VFADLCNSTFPELPADGSPIDERKGGPPMHDGVVGGGRVDGGKDGGGPGDGAGNEAVREDCDADCSGGAGGIGSRESARFGALAKDGMLDIPTFGLFKHGRDEKRGGGLDMA